MGVDHGTSRKIEIPYNVFVAVELGLGTPAQPLDFLIDTGSSWMWAWADLCNSTVTTGAVGYNNYCYDYNDRFHTTESSTFRRTGETKQVNYGRGRGIGPVVLDTVTYVGDHRTIVAEDFTFFV